MDHYWYLNRQVPGRTLLGHRKAGMAHCKLAGWEKVTLTARGSDWAMAMATAMGPPGTRRLLDNNQ
ncbi:hypothetical protein L6272_02185 [Microgenomates group bacterium]|nr:hypothetical protein [Microgenomates group bacterium]